MEQTKFYKLLEQNGFSQADSAQGGISFLGSGRDLEAAIEFVEDHETPKAVVGGEFYKVGINGVKKNNAIIVLTDERIIKADKKIRNVDIETFYIDDVKSSAFKSAFLSSAIEISTTSGNMRIDKVKKDTGKRFNDALNNEIRAAKKANRGGGTAALSGMDELKKAKDLLDAGIIDQSEFDAIKKKYIG